MAKDKRTKPRKPYQEQTNTMQLLPKTIESGLNDVHISVLSEDNGSGKVNIPNRYKDPQYPKYIRYLEKTLGINFIVG